MSDHGTVTRYRRGCKCTSCRRAHSDYRHSLVQERLAQRVLIDGRLVAPLPPEQHGKWGGYTNWGCRCEPCTEANREGMRGWYRARRGAS